MPFVLAISAASFLYIGMADLIPHLHSDRLPASALEQILLVLAGVALIAAIRQLAQG